MNLLFNNVELIKISSLHSILKIMEIGRIFQARFAL